MRLVPLALLLCGCALFFPKAPPALCTTACGVRVLDPAPAEWCPGAQEVETRALKAFSAPSVVAADDRFGQACARLDRWQVKVSAGPPRAGEAGETNVLSRVMYVENASSPAASALAHEMAHAIQSAEPRPPISAVDPDHSNWGPIYGALADAGLSQ